MSTKALESTVLVGAHLLDDGARQSRVMRIRGCKPALVLGETKRDYTQASNLGMGLAVFQRARKLLAIVEAGAQHDLRMDLDPRSHEQLENFHAASGVPTDETAAHLGRHRMYGDIHGREVLGDDVFNILIAHVGQRDKITLQE